MYRIGLTAAAVVLAMALPGATEDTTLGAGVSLEEATPIGALVERPAEFAGKTIRIDGVATAVCEHMGCWMAVSADGKEGSPTVRLKVEDGVIVFPVTAKGRSVSAQGVFEQVGADAESKEAAGEHAAHDPQASLQYQLAATGAVIRH